MKGQSPLVILALIGVVLMAIGGLGFVATIMNPNVTFVGLMLIGGLFIAVSSKFG